MGRSISLSGPSSPLLQITMVVACVVSVGLRRALIALPQGCPVSTTSHFPTEDEEAKKEWNGILTSSMTLTQ